MAVLFLTIHKSINKISSIIGMIFIIDLLMMSLGGKTSLGLCLLNTES